MSRKSGRFAIHGKYIGAIVDQKNEAYGDAVNKTAQIMEILYPNGIPKESYKNVLLITRVVDKLCRIATDQDAFGENPWDDVAGYGIRGALRESKRKLEIHRLDVDFRKCTCGHIKDQHNHQGFCEDCSCMMFIQAPSEE
jgi:hypothetical protein